MKRKKTWWMAIILMTAATTRAKWSQAQSSETSRMTAETLFVEAKKLMDAGRFGEACPKFADSQRLDPGVGTLLNLALCYERQGRVASAWSTYREAASAARSAGQSERENVARQRAAGLELRLSRLTVTVSPALSSTEGLEVRLDGIVMPASLWGVAAPVDPGSHHVEVSSKGHRPWSTTVQVVPPQNPTVIVPELEVAPLEVTKSVSPEPGTEPVRHNTERTLALVAGGAGVVGLGVGTAFGLSARSTYRSSDALCNAKNVCSDEGTTKRDDAFDKAAIATVAFGVGGAAIISGVILWFTAPKTTGESEPPRPAVSVGPSGLFVSGVW